MEPGSISIEFKPSVEKDLRRLPQSLLARVMRRLESLRAEPLPPQAAKIVGSEQLYRLRVGDYRVIYEFDRLERRVVVHYVRHRRAAYREL